MEPTLAVLAYSAAAALVSAFGVLPLLGRERVPRSWLGWSNAAAAGMMLAGAFVLFEAGIGGAAPAFGLGALGGIVFVAWTHRASGDEDLDLDRIDQSAPTRRDELLLINALHSGVEGVAIGAAMASEPLLGLFMASAIAVHNVPEATLLATVLRSRGMRLKKAATLVVLSNVSQILTAVATYAIVTAAPGQLPWAMGMAAGALIYLVMADLLPASYRQEGATAIALVTVVSMGVFALMHGWIRG